MAFKEFSLCAQASIHMPWLERSAPSKRACYMTWPEAAKKDITGQDSSQERWIALEVLAVNFQWFCNGVYYNALYILVNLFVGFVACIVTWVIDVIQTSVLVCVCALLHFVWRLQLTAEQCGSRLVLVGWLTVWKRERERERDERSVISTRGCMLHSTSVNYRVACLHCQTQQTCLCECIQTPLFPSLGLTHTQNDFTC